MHRTDQTRKSFFQCVVVATAFFFSSLFDMWREGRVYTSHDKCLFKAVKIVFFFSPPACYSEG